MPDSLADLDNLSHSFPRGSNIANKYIIWLLLNNVQYSK